MPYKPLKICAEQGCNKLTSERYCALHKNIDKKRYDKTRRTSTERGYDARHRSIREFIKKEEPLCRECLKNELLVPGTEMDHIDGNPFNVERENLQMLCSPCHSRKTIREQGGFGHKKNKGVIIND